MRTANIATYPARLPNLLQMLKSIEGQFDLVRICLNGYDAIPPELAAYECHIPEGDLVDTGKFLWLKDATLEDLYFTLDDDLIYPPDYADRMAALTHDAQIVTAHGHIITDLRQNWHDGHRVHAFTTAHVAVACHVHAGGTGCMVIRGGTLNPDLSLWPGGMADADLALEAAENSIAILLAPHVQGWIKEQASVKGTPLSTTTRTYDRLTDIGDRIFTVWNERGGLPADELKTIYTVITNGYDMLRQPTHITPGWEYLCVTDEPYRMKASGTGAWSVVDLADFVASSVYDLDHRGPRQQRLAKILGPKHYNGRSIYVDGNMVIQGDLDVLVMESGHIEVTAKKHPSRKCVFEEMDAVVQMKRAPEHEVKAWRDLLVLLGRRKDAGLSETGILIRDHNDSINDRVQMACAVWALLLLRHSHRDQLTFDLAMDLFGVLNRAECAVFDKFIKWTPHSARAVVSEMIANPMNPTAPKLQVDTVAAKDGPAPPALPTLGIVTSSTEATMGLVPLFVMAALEHNPDAVVTVIIPPDSEIPDMDPVVDRHGVLNYIIAPATVMDGSVASPEVGHYLYPPPKHTELLFCCPVDHMILTDLRKVYLPIMQKDGLDYVNNSNEYETRLGPLHFTKWDAMHPHPLVAQKGYDLFKPAGHTLGRIVSVVTKRPLRFSTLPATGFRVLSRIGMAEEWAEFTCGEAFTPAAKDLSEDAMVWLTGNSMKVDE